MVTGADKACETLALSGMDARSAALSFGTTATIEVATDRFFNALPLIPPYRSITGGFLPEVETFRGYWLISCEDKRGRGPVDRAGDREACGRRGGAAGHRRALPGPLPDPHG